jgi:CAP-Gly domain-containing linker protein 1
MQPLTQLVYFDLPIPVWHIVSYVAVMSLLMSQRKFKLAIVTSYALVLFWFHYAFRAELVALINGDNVARTVYYALAFALVLLSIYALFLLEDEEAEFELEKRRKEIAGLRAKAKEAKKKVTELKAQLKKDQSHDSASRDQLEEEFKAEIQSLEGKLRESESRIEQRETQIAELQSKILETEENASALKSQLEKDQSQDSASRDQLEEEFNIKIQSLEVKLKASQRLIEEREAEISELQTKTQGAEKDTDALRAQLESLQLHGSSTDQQPDRELQVKIADLEKQLKESESLLGIRKVKMDELKARTRDAEKHAVELKAQLEKDQTNQSNAKKKLETEFNAKVDKLHRQLKESAGVLEKRDTEIAELQAKTRDAERHAATLKAQSAKDQAEESASRSKREEEFNDKIMHLETRLRERESLLEKRDAEIAEFQAKTREVEKDASALKAQLEKNQAQEFACRSKIEEELNAKIDRLENRLEENKGLLERRDAEIAELQAKARDAEKDAASLKAQIAKDQDQECASRSRLEEELNTKIDKLEDQLEERASLLERRNAEIAELQAKARDAEKDAASLKAQLTKDLTQESASRSKLEKEFSAKVDKLENQLEESRALLERRSAEIAELQAKARDAEKDAASLKAQLTKDQTQESASKSKLVKELTDRITNLENLLKESESLLQKRDTEIAALRPKGPATDKKSGPLKPLLGANRLGAAPKGGDDKKTVEEDVRKKLHQFQYAVKYLEDQIKEKDRLLGLMAKKGTQSQGSIKQNTVDDDLKRKVQQLEQSVKYFEGQVKEKDGLLGLMAKRNRELAEAKTKAEEKLERSQAQNDGGQAHNGG